MGSRFGRVLLIAAAILIVLGGGAAAALLATSDDEGGGESIQLGGSVDAGDGAESSDSTPGTEPPAAPTETEAPAAEPPKAEDAPATGGTPRETQFPRERRQEAQNDPPERVFTVPPARRFTGNGNATLGTVDLSRAAVVKWTTTGRFELRFGRESFPIVAPSPSGRLAVPPYDFEQVRVIAKGRWTITITPQK